MMCGHMRGRGGPWWPARIVGFVIVGMAGAVLMALLFGLLVQALWNWVMPAVFGLGIVTFWQAFGLVLLGKLLFGGIGGHRGRGFGFKGRRGGMHRGEAAGEQWGPTGNWHEFREYWHAEGRSAFEQYLSRKAAER